ncbi:MAG: hypothetical protein DRP87_00940 [Spirochaetes bacterium]|nr:MAG: hypothetical protein DRP87_00940 [Spirochaetota bacterium]
MKVLIAYASEQGAIIDAIVDTCRRIKLGVDLYEVSHGETALESGLYERLSSSSSVLLVISQERFSEGWVVFSVGYMLGRGDRGLLYIPFMEREIPEYFKKLSIASSQKELEYYYREEKRIWNQRIAVERAKTKLAAKGISFTEPAFIKCVERGEKTAVRCFLAAGFSPNVRNEKGVPLLSLAVRNRKKELIPMLLSAGADLNIISPDNGNSPLMDAAAIGERDIVERFIESGANLNVQSKNGQTALILAVGKGSYDIAEKLIRSGADISIKDNLGMSAIQYARLFKRNDIIKVIEHCVN